MANGTVADEFVVLSQVRSGLKRELQFVLRSQSEICGGGSLGRTRGRKNLNGGIGGDEKNTLDRGFGLKTGRKKRRVGKDGESNGFDKSDSAGGVVEEDEAKSDVVDIDEAKGDFGESVSKRLFSDEATLAIVEDSAMEQSGEPMTEDEEQQEKRVKEEDNVPEHGKCEEENGKDRELENEHGNLVIDGDKPGNAFEKEEHERGLQKEKLEKEGENESLILNGKEDVIDRETGLLCKIGASVSPKPTSGFHKARNVKPQNGLVRDTSPRRFTRSMLKPKPEVITSEGNADQEQRDLERGINCNGNIDVGVSGSRVCRRKSEDSHEQIRVEPCAGDSNGSSQVDLLPCNGDKRAENGSVDKPLRRFTRSVLKQEADSNNSNATKNVELDKVEEDSSDIETDDVRSPAAATARKRGRPKKFLRNFPERLKDLLDSGVLEGLTVYYLRGAKIREAGTTGLKGVIRGSGVLCFCGACKGAQVVTPTVYELHASSSNRRPPEYILLETGNTLRDVMNACKEAPLAALEEKLRTVVGPTMKKSSLCFNCQGPMTEPCDTKTLVLCKSCVETKEQQKVSQTSAPKSFAAVERSPEPSVGPEATLSESKSSSFKSNSQGRLTRKDVRLHKLVFEEDILPDGSEVGYFVAGKKMLVGYKKGFGIHCSCCNEVVSPSLFEAHAGFAPRRKPFQHIYTSNGVSLHELSVALSRERRFTVRENDDLCSICRDGGDLLCCDTCPRSFHTVCASLPSLPNGGWSCKYCVNMLLREKFVESNANAIAAGRVAGVDAIAQITKRCIRIVNSLGSGLPSVCVLCRGHSFSRLGFGPRTVIICDQCEKEFHVGCLKEHNIDDLKELPEGQWFCSSDCRKIQTSLHNLIIHGEEKLNNNILNFIRKKPIYHEENGSDDKTNLDIRWRVLSGKLATSDDAKTLLAKAVSIFHERFDPISESGARGDLIPAMVYGRKVKGQDFGGMYCTILTVNQVIVSVGIFRIFGSELAELPLVATSNEFQRQGYFQCLFTCIQRLLGFLSVKQLVLPAADEAKSIWTDKFGFIKMTDDEVNEYRKDFQVMVFEGTSMLGKPVPAPRAITAKPEPKTDQ